MTLATASIDLLNEAAEGKAVDIQARACIPLTRRGLIDERGLITPDGVLAYGDAGGELIDINYLMLGIPVTHTIKQKDGDNVKLTMKVGSRLMVVFKEKLQGTWYYSCFAGQEIGMVYISHNSKHTFGSHKYPAKHPLNASFR